MIHVVACAFGLLVTVALLLRRARSPLGDGSKRRVACGATRRKGQAQACDDWPDGAYTDQNYLCYEPKPKVYLKTDAEIRAVAKRVYFAKKES
jgi:hypothetical protein